jgi:2-C-methyl-D-erythritol 4-phosphate cytidylyltransferase/2-C-methyl-D-erythritol 2,4-cyclodiphosphate synthase
VYNFVTPSRKKGYNLSDLTLILLAAGSSSRFGSKIKKQWLRVDKTPLWQFVAQRLQKVANVDKIVITAAKNEINYMKKFGNFEIVEGGKTRAESLLNALKSCKSEYVLTTDIARCCISEDLVKRVLAKKGEADCVVPVLKASDTIYFQDRPINRDEVKIIQTPQLSKREVLIEALKQSINDSDDSTAIFNIGGKVEFVEGEKEALKLTFIEDLKSLGCLKPTSTKQFTGSGFDVHPFEKDKRMYLGGVEIESDFGFRAHSDGDVALHAVIDAILGAVGAGDIGELFPDSSDEFKGIDSKELLKRVDEFVKSIGYIYDNIDITIIAQKPRIGEYKEAMREVIAKILELEKIRVNIKATTTEKLGFVGRGEGVAVQAVATRSFNKELL